MTQQILRRRLATPRHEGAKLSRQCLEAGSIIPGERLSQNFQVFCLGGTTIGAGAVLQSRQKMLRHVPHKQIGHEITSVPLVWQHPYPARQPRHVTAPRRGFGAAGATPHRVGPRIKSAGDESIGAAGYAAVTRR
jgi:hypothetical protein